jgi:hypothetical protein
MNEKKLTDAVTRMCERYDWFERSCSNCKYNDKDVYEEPCVNCKHNFVAGTPEYESHELLWESPDTPDTPDVPIDNPVTHPSHYTQGNIQCIDAMEAAFGKEQVAIWCKLNAFKYVWREEHKSGLQDIDKAIWYLNKYKELKYSG